LGPVYKVVTGGEGCYVFAKVWYCEERKAVEVWLGERGGGGAELLIVARGHYLLPFPPSTITLLRGTVKLKFTNRNLAQLMNRKTVRGAYFIP